MHFTGVEIFSATMARDRAALGDRITAWLSEHRVDVVDKVVLQSSDSEYHCISVVLFYRHRRARA
jgi:hypothetical protein